MPNIRWLLALITAVHRALYRSTGGLIGARFFRARMLLLETRGWRSGQARVTPLLFVEDGARFVVVASNAGDDRDPAWLKNLRKEPQAFVQVGKQRIAVRARDASADESARLWPRLESSYKYYPDYRVRTKRHIPIIVLEPLENSFTK
jgi:deazaflavin-dependent oxidoreductase (nitroreductase family)